MTERDGNNPFALQKYFVSFYDQKLQTADMEGLIICTNSDIDENAKDIWQAVDVNASTSSSTPSMDSYISSLFAKVGGKCYQLDYDKLKDGKLNKLYELFKQCTKRGRLVKLLVNAIKSKEKITRRNVLFKEYRLAILDIIDKQSISSNGSYGFTKEFLDLSSPNTTPGYEAFRKEFDEQYQQELINSSSSKDSSGLENLKLKRVFVAKDFFSDFKNDVILPEIFPDDKDDESKLKTFCERFRFVCATKSEHEVDELIVEFWRDLVSDDDQRKGAVEENVAIEKLFKTNFNWLMNPFAKPLHSNDIQKDLDNIKNTLAHIKLKGASEKLRKQVMGTSFRINPDALRNSELYEQVQNETILEIEACDMQFAGALLIDILSLDGKELHNTLLLEDAAFTDDSKTVEEVFRSAEHSIHLIIICDQAFKTVQGIVRRFRKHISKDILKQVFLIRNVSNTPNDVSCFCIRDVTENSWQQFLDEHIPLCTTTISTVNIFQNNFQELSIEEIIKQLDHGEQMRKNNEIVKTYQEIENTYVQRYWIDQTFQLEELYSTYYIEGIIKDLHQLQGEKISCTEITKHFKSFSTFDRIFNEENALGNQGEPIIVDNDKKVLILLGEAGDGKSTNLTWLAWHLLQHNPSSWVVRCNLSDHCTDFKYFMEGLKNETEMVINENEALRMLYELIHLSLVEITNRDLQTVRLNARKCSECLILSNGQAVLNEELRKQHGLSLTHTIQLLVFIDKFNACELILLMDGFDEIAPHYKEVVLLFLSLFAQFDGVNKLYLTTRPYSFKEQFNKVFEEPVQFQLKPLSLHDKATMLYKIIKLKIHNVHKDINLFQFYKVLCVMLIFYLAEMSALPLNLMMSVDILIPLVDRYINFDSKIVNSELFKAMQEISKPSFIVEKFVEIKIKLMYYKIGAKPNAADNPILIDDHVNKIAKIKGQHGLVALWVFFGKNELDMILSDFELQEANAYMNEIYEAMEKTGIINEIHDEIPKFIHRTFAEYLAAWWIVKRQIEGQRHGRIKIFSLETYWKQNGLRKHVDRMLAKHYPIHLSIIEQNVVKIDSLASTDPKAFREGDDGNRTPLHLLACYMGFNENIDFSLKSVEPDIINQKEKLFGWTALDCAFYYNCHMRTSTDGSYLIFYLLHHGASINVDVLFEQAVSPLQVKVRPAALCAEHVMRYLSRLGIEYESHIATKTMKQFCDKVAAHVINEQFVDFGRNNELSVEEKFVFEEIIQTDSAWMLESIIQQLTHPEPIHFMVSNSFFDLALKAKSICVLKCFFENNPSLLTEEIFRQCITMGVVGDYKNEFKFFIDLYCRRMCIKDFKACSIQNENNSNALFQKLYDKDEDILNIFRMNDLLLDNLSVTVSSLPPQLAIDKNISSVLIICLTTVRPIMLRYLKKSCELQLCTGFTYYLARVTDYYMKELHENWYETFVLKKYEKRESKLNRLKKVFDCLLDQVSITCNVNVNEMLRYAITSELFKFSECLIARYEVNFQAIDEINGWNVFHLCVSRPRSNDDNVQQSMLELFRSMLDREAMDCFRILDKADRSILYLSIENGHEDILDHIIALKLGLKQLDEIDSLSVDAIPNLTFCFRAIQRITERVGEKGCYHNIFYMLVKTIVNIALTIPNESNQQSNSARVLLEENAQELYQVAMKCGSLSLMYYMHHEFRCTNPKSIDDVNWLAWIKMSLNFPDFRLFRWIVSQYCAAHYITHHIQEENCEDFSCNDIEEFDANWFDRNRVKLEKLVEQVGTKLSHYKSMEEAYILQLLVLTVSRGHERATRYLCETFSVNIDHKVLFDIVEIAHHTLVGDCAFETCYARHSYKYLFERSSICQETDAEGKTWLHLAGDSGPNCMIWSLFKHYMSKSSTINEKNVWYFFHYFVKRKPNEDRYKSTSLMLCKILKELLTNDELTVEGKSQSRESKLKKLCLNSNDGRKSVLHVFMASGRIIPVKYIISLRLGVENIEDHKITTIDDCLRFKECYDIVDQIAALLPLNVESEKLLNSIARPIDSFTLRNIKIATIQENVEYKLGEEACRAAIKYRSVSTMDHLMVGCKHQMKQSLAGSSSRILFACMMQCIRRNWSNLFRVFAGHYRSAQGIKPSIEVEYEKEVNDSEVEALIEFFRIQWKLADHVAQDMPIKRDYLLLLILSSAYGRLSMTRSLIEMLELVVNKSVILLLIKAAQDVGNCEHRVAVYEYLSTVAEGNIYLLHLCYQSLGREMVDYLTGQNLDPCEIDLETGWNAGHYLVSEQECYTDPYEVLHRFESLLEKTSIDCFGVHDHNGRNVFHLAIENGHTKVAKAIIRNRLNLTYGQNIRKAWNLHKINECIDELQRLKDNKKILKMLQKLTDRKKFLLSFAQVFDCFPSHTY